MRTKNYRGNQYENGRKETLSSSSRGFSGGKSNIALAIFAPGFALTEEDETGIRKLQNPFIQQGYKR